MARTAQRDVTTSAPPTLYVALELSKNNWKLAFTTSRIKKARIRDVMARDLSGFLAEVEAAKKRFDLPEEVPVKSCYEAGRDGFWIHRLLQAKGISNLVVDPASIEVPRRSRRAKTDRIDAHKLVQLLVRHHDGEEVLHIVCVPPSEAEDERLLPRQLKMFKRKRTQATNQIRAALFLHGLDLDPRKPQFVKKLKQARQWDGSVLPSQLLELLRMLWAQYTMFSEQIKQLEHRQRKVLCEARRDGLQSTSAQRKAARLSQLCGVGDIGAYTLTTEFFGWRVFDNRKELGALAGLTGTPYHSGGSAREQGISKAGNPRVRTLMIELAWLWLRWQPHSRMTLWFQEHVGKAGTRARRKAIVALARKLLVEFWHFIEHGVVPDGAVLKDATAKKPGSLENAA